MNHHQSCLKQGHEVLIWGTFKLLTLEFYGPEKKTTQLLFHLKTSKYFCDFTCWLSGERLLPFGLLVTGSSFLQVTRTCIKAWMSWNVGKIPPQNTELAAIERLKNQCIML